MFYDYDYADSYANSVEPAWAQSAAHSRYPRRLILSTRWIFRITRGADLIHVLISRFGYLTVR